MSTEFLMKPLTGKMLQCTAKRPGVRWLNCSQKSLIYAAEQYKLDLKDRNKESVHTYVHRHKQLFIYLQFLVKVVHRGMDIFLHLAGGAKG